MTTSANPAATAPAAQSPPMHESHLGGLPRLHQGKVRDIYAIPGDARHMLIVTTDRLSAFDVVLPDPIPGKGRVLTEISRFWFERTGHIVPNHLAAPADGDLARVVPDAAERALLTDRAMVVRKLKALPVEAVVRGYLIGSGWKDYQRTGEVCGIRLPAGLRMADRLPEPIFTPSTKAPKGQHDENVGYDEIAALIGPALAAQVRDTAIALYRYAAAHALERGIIIADTKFEFGIDEQNGNRLTLIDEALTPDSSRFWPVDTYAPGTSPPSFDKQFVRDYLETLDWNKTAPGPRLPADVIRRTAEKYAEALRRLTA
jgi:phosphoribosylaminoimidazole-succinocarboxamide synthase